MSSVRKPLRLISCTLGAFLVGSLSPPESASADQSPFASRALAGGYMLAGQENAGSGEGKCGEGKCGSKTDQEAVCGIYQIGSGHKDESKVKDGKCGGHKVVEALCGGDR